MNPPLSQSDESAGRRAGRAGEPGDSRLDRKERNRKKPDFVAAFRFLLLTLLVAQCLRVAFTSPRLRLQEVKVTGTGRLTPAQVREIGNVRLGQNIFCVNLTRVSRRMLGQPFIREAVVTRELPNALNVTLRERTPFLQAQAGAKLFHADEDGVVFQEAGARTSGMPTLELPARALPPLGKKLGAETLRTVRDCLRLARKETLDVRKMRIDEGGELWLNIATSPTSHASNPGLEVRVGRATELPEKFRDIRQALAARPDLPATATYLNVMCAGRTAYLRLSENPQDRDKTATN